MSCDDDAVGEKTEGGGRILRGAHREDDNRHVVTLAAGPWVPRRPAGRRKGRVFTSGDGSDGRLSQGASRVQCVSAGPRRSLSRYQGGDLLVEEVVEEPIGRRHDDVARRKLDFEGHGAVERVSLVHAADLIGVIEAFLLWRGAVGDGATPHHHESAVADADHPEEWPVHRPDARRRRPPSGRPRQCSL